MSYLSIYKPVTIIAVAAAFTANMLMAHAADIPQPPTLAVKSYQLYDFNSERVIAEQDGNSRVEPASLTKIMTAYLAFKAIKNGHLTLTQTLPVSVKAWKVEGSKMFIEPNKPVTVDELLHGMIIQSGNDASIALAEGIAGSEEGFAELMNKEAARLGMKGTHYVNATGLPDPQHYTTAHDLALLAAALIRDFPDHYKRLYSMKEYTYNKISQPNRNRLLWLDPYVDGMKTGHTKSAGYCLVTSAKRGDTRMISVVLGAPSDAARATESQKLLNYGFQFYESKLVYKRGAEVSSLKVWKGAENSVVATVAKNVSITLPKGEYARVKAKVVSQQPLIAPVSAGQQVGKIQFILDDKVIAEHKLVAAKNVAVAGIFGRMLDTIKLWFE
ncbi:D-alanyl-D-alanine carboxypeptidase family protein [Methylobacillus flagellatus]|uniref:serine-type D-Ala-D-Ala carboxypeptidase n=1 Tax=Methylobacillus flagellatus (strain ATCC 51484 / DSM 6875 / VKM B-1610 / KT) TaxID=265072 RepID=Q1GYC5_METFK|nr:D-alanyl-D-alanine carboxypeptidase family protein [Methylobacillus flagellatus]ABE50762.1 penicillin-binding protein 6, Serine peptidase, MEROPS family S11 [Methylobacillus flagellatus KT]